MIKFIENFCHAFFGFYKAVFVDLPYNIKNNYYMNKYWGHMYWHYILLGYDSKAARKLVADEIEKYYNDEDEE